MFLNHNTSNNMNYSRKINEVKHIRTFDVACKECNAISSDEFKKKWMQKLNNRLRMYGKLKSLSK